MAAVLYILLLLVAYVLYGAYWRLYLSPIAHIPGPRLAALTRLYEAYYDVFLGGKYTFKIIELHKQYGPILRISPWEIHVSDPDFYDVIYASSASNLKRDKYEWFSKSFGQDKSAFGTHDHDLHKLRRSALNPFFSLQNVRRLQPVILERVHILLDRFREFRESGKVLNASCASSAFTNDIVMQFSFSRCDNRLKAPDFDPSYRDASFFGSTSNNFLKHAPWINNFMQSIPDSIAQLLHPVMTEYIRQKRGTRQQIAAIVGGKDPINGDLNYPTIFHSILDAKLPPQEKTVERLTDDAQVLMMAGTLTTAWALDVIMFWLLSQPETLFKLKQELRQAIPDPNDIGILPLPTLEQLPYLSAVILEGLRLSYGVSCRLARISYEDITYIRGNESYLIPAGTPMGMTSTQIHHDERLFPNSKTFLPERWLDGDNVNKELEKYLLSFSGGSRQCVGINLAYAEMYSCLSAVWRVWGSSECRGPDDEGIFELYETGKRDVEIESDHFLPIQQEGSKGIRVVARC